MLKTSASGARMKNLIFTAHTTRVHPSHPDRLILSPTLKGTSPSPALEKLDEILRRAQDDKSE
jgi:hypothetical protein